MICQSLVFDFLGAAANKPHFGWLSFSWLLQKEDTPYSVSSFFWDGERSKFLAALIGEKALSGGRPKITGAHFPAC